MKRKKKNIIQSWKQNIIPSSKISVSNDFFRNTYPIFIIHHNRNSITLNILFISNFAVNLNSNNAWNIRWHN